MRPGLAIPLAGTGKPIERVERWLFAAPAWQLVVGLLLVTLVKTGIWQIPNFGAMRLIAQDPFVNPFANPDAHALYWTWLGPFLAWLAGATEPWSFFALHLLFSMAFTAVMVGTTFRLLPAREARVSVLLFAVLPVSATAYFWVSNDSLTLFLMACALVASRRPAAAALGLALGTQHFEQAFLGFAGLLLALLIARRQRAPVDPDLIGRVLVLLAGIVAGKLALVALFGALGVEVNSGRLYWLREHLPLLLAQFFLHTHLILFSVLGLGWLVVVKQLEWDRDRVAFLVPLGAAMLLLPISGDQTRVLAIVTFPLIAIFWLRNQAFLAFLSDRFAAWLLLAWLVVPWTWVWGGEPWWSAFPYDVAFVLGRVFGWSVPEPALTPF